METTRVFWHIRQRIVHLVIEDHVFIVDVFHRDPRRFVERHWPITIKRTAGIDAHRERVDLAILIPSAGKKGADRAFDRRIGLTVPVKAHYRSSPVPGRCHPNLLDAAWTL